MTNGLVHFALQGKVGDVVLTTPVIRKWLEVHGNTGVVFWTKPACQWIYQDWPQVDVRILNPGQEWYDANTIPLMRQHGATTAISFRLHPDKQHLLDKYNLLECFFAAAGLPLPSKPTTLEIPIIDPRTRASVQTLTRSLGPKFVIISRHSQSLPTPVTKEWWLALISQLTLHNYRVLDNIVGQEAPLPDTIPLVNYPYRELLLLSERARATVGVRSSVMDVVAAGRGRTISFMPNILTRLFAFSKMRIQGDITDIVVKSNLPAPVQVLSMIESAVANHTATMLHF